MNAWRTALLAAALLGLGGPALTQSAPCRNIVHAAGVSCVPAQPRRVVVLDAGPLDTMLAVGVRPVGAVQRDAGSAVFVNYLAPQTAGIQSVGTITEPSLERIAALRPDLILSSKLRHGEVYAQLSRIAPTVLSESVGFSWREDTLLWADAAGKKARAESLLRQYRARARLVGSRYRGTVSVVRFLPGQTRIMLRDNFIGTILDDAGIRRPAGQQANDFARMVGPEAIPQMDGDTIFYTAWNDEQSTRREITGSPLWQNLRGVRSQRAFFVSDDHWMVGTGIQAAFRVLADLERHAP